jgi:hypothetical protein
VPPNALTKGPIGVPLLSARPVGTRQRMSPCRVPLCGHSAKAPSPLPGAVMTTFLCQVPVTLSKDFAE